MVVVDVRMRFVVLVGIENGVMNVTMEAVGMLKNVDQIPLVVLVRIGQMGLLLQVEVVH